MMGPLFDKGSSPSVSPSKAAVLSGGIPRLRVPHRLQVEMHCASLDELLEADHRARLVWAAVAGLPLDGWLKEIKAVEGNVGRDATDPRLLVALWVYATLEGVAHARELGRLCEKHLAYQWLCGGVRVNYHLLADFRSQGGEHWDQLLTEIVAALLAEGLVTLKRVAQDGMRVRAQAGKSSFRRRTTLQRYRDEAEEQVRALKRLAEEDPAEGSLQQRAARERAARERAERIAAAIQHCRELQTRREARAKVACEAAQEARASTTDPEARNMKFANGGYHPGYNVQFSTTTDSGVIVGVEVNNAGSDGKELPPMLDQIEQRYQGNPEEVVVDGGFATKEAIADAAENHACTVYAPLKDKAKQYAQGVDPHARKKGDSPAVAAWRTRMETAAAQAIYRLRCQTAEWVNALVRNRGLQQMPVRGLRRCRSIATLHAITHNLMQAIKLRAKFQETSA